MNHIINYIQVKSMQSNGYIINKLFKLQIFVI